MKPWQIVLVGAAFVVLVTSVIWAMSGRDGPHLADGILMADVQTGQTYFISTDGRRAVIPPAINPDTGQRTLVPVEENKDTGQWVVKMRYWSDEDLGDLDMTALDTGSTPYRLIDPILPPKRIKPF